MENLENRTFEINLCSECRKPTLLISSGEKVSRRCAHCQHAQGIQPNRGLMLGGSASGGRGIPIPPRPTVEESQKRTKETIKLVQNQERKQNLPWASICQNEVSEQARNEQSSEMGRQEFLEAQSRTRQTIAVCERLKRGEESQAKIEGYVNLFEQLGRVAALQEAERLEKLERHRRICEGKKE